MSSQVGRVLGRALELVAHIVGQRRAKIRVAGDKVVETPAVEAAGFDVRQRDTAEIVRGILFEVAAQVTDRVHANDLAAPVLEATEYQRDALGNLVEVAHRIAGLEHELALVPALSPAERQEVGKPLIVEWRANADRAAK